ncbi:hypothetical protein OG921_07225 [Aldersonia sp. NBC_00410]|uniref:hypothetical protein n=1 Tax=Aldersonia sp. NBC_00410 TaxID=2975954 RepID=UPI00225672C3|nr:hypothetical protein [Aldersonia sp. NBC_00410]MCX5042957.1 hypothetical protein [Aldersonia sp. NBC_00410]
MSWTDLHQRNAIIDEVLARAERNPDDPELFRDLPDLDRLFGGIDGLLLTLQYRWRNHVTARLDLAEEKFLDPQQVVADLAAEQPALRAVLDRWQAPTRVAAPSARGPRRRRGPSRASQYVHVA